MNICKILKFGNGDTIIGVITNESPEWIDVMNPFQIHQGYPDQESRQMNLEVLKWDFCSDYSTAFRVYKTGIVSLSDPTENMENSYHEVVESRDLNSEKESATGFKAVDAVEEFKKKLQKMMDEKKNIH
jgi:hypothetical protein